MADHHSFKNARQGQSLQGACTGCTGFYTEYEAMDEIVLRRSSGFREGDAG